MGDKNLGDDFPEPEIAADDLLLDVDDYAPVLQPMQGTDGPSKDSKPTAPSGGDENYEGVAEAKLEFQEFINEPEVHAQEKEAGQFVSQERPEPTAPQPLPEPLPQEPVPEDEANLRFWHLKYYQRFFDVDTDVVIERGLHALSPLPNRGDFLQKLSGKPDLYGPIWIGITFIFVMGIFGNLLSRITFNPSAAMPEWQYNLKKLSVGATVTFMYLCVFPLILWGVCKYYIIEVRLANAWCVYGYSLVPFLPAAIVASIPLEWLMYVAFIAAMVISTYFLVISLRTMIITYIKGTNLLIILGLLGAVHVAFALPFVFYVMQ